MTTQTTLETWARESATVLPGLRVGRHLSIQERYDEWRATPDGEAVYEAFVARALSLYHRGWKHYGHKAIVESIRYDRALAVGPAGGFKVNDHFTSRMVREAVQAYPELDGFFETRSLKA